MLMQLILPPAGRSHLQLASRLQTMGWESCQLWRLFVSTRWPGTEETSTSSSWLHVFLRVAIHLKSQGCLWIYESLMWFSAETKEKMTKMKWNTFYVVVFCRCLFQCSIFCWVQQILTSHWYKTSSSFVTLFQGCTTSQLIKSKDILLTN